MMLGRDLAADIPVTIDRDAAREAAREELSKRIYDDAQPPLIVRGVRWVLERLGDALDGIAAATPGGWWALLVLATLLAVAVFAIIRGVGPVRRMSSTERSMFATDRRRSSADHRASADRARQQGDWTAAVRERFRAIIRTLEERGLLDERPGRTADEAAAEAGRALPQLGADLRAGARTFDEVVYGGHPATRQHDDGLQMLDEAVRRSRAVKVAS